ncbi:hypothetical protein AAG747_08955 [Rapidithrix thailandica]|uniref:SPOR domain-containing protein n=1 Tax=Rapidithrix thailandica TaxID=413964 RepID=A0AAW9RSZ6_9BACT
MKLKSLLKLIFILVVVILILFLWKNPGEQPGTNGQPVPEVNDPSVIGPAIAPVYSEDDSVRQQETEENTKDQDLMDTLPQRKSEGAGATTDTVSSLKVRSGDSLRQVLKDNPLGNGLSPVGGTPLSESSMYSMRVKKQEGTLLYVIHGKELESLKEALAELPEGKSLIVQFSGNVTYAEQRDVKQSLKDEQIDFKLLNYQ